MAASIKILHVIARLDPGGMENGIANIAKALQPQGFDTHVACLERAGDFVQRMPRPDQVYVLGKQNTFSIAAVAALTRLIFKVKPDVIHSHNVGPLIYSGLSTAGGTFRPILQGEHAEFTVEDCRPKRLRQRHLFYRTCRKVHTVSEGLRQQMIGLGFSGDKIVAVPNGVDTRRFSPGSQVDARRQLNLPAEAIIFGIVGRFGMFKRHSLLIDAFNDLAAQNANLHLLIVGGGGSETERVHAQAKGSPFAARIHFTGLQHDLAPYYRAINLLVSPSVNEGMSNAVLESMSCATPALANATCGNDEVITHGRDGIIADLSSSEKLRCELQKVLVEPAKLVTMGQIAREKIERQFSIETMVENYRSLYREVAKL
jgi:glycosyltransferase involved in cell wall biosynthesis